jgi:predicted transcriptional regulator
VVDNEGNVVGFITTTDIAMLVGSGEDLDAPVSKYMRRTVFTISERESLLEAMRIMDFYGVGRLVVLNSARKPVGMVTRTDILRYILAL